MFRPPSCKDYDFKRSKGRQKNLDMSVRRYGRFGFNHQRTHGDTCDSSTSRQWKISSDSTL
eukprot:1388380-Pyramimonas_sp.AAC.1